MKIEEREFPCHRAIAFTLVEVLVAVAVLAIVLVLLLAVSSGTLSTTRAFNQKMEARSQARMVADALAGDLENAPVSRGLTVLASQQAGTDANSELALVTQGRGPVANSRFSSVAYQLDSQGDMRRFCEAVLWNDQNLLADASQAIVAGNSTVVAKGILRFSVIALLDDGAAVPLTDSGTNATWKLPVDGASGSPFFALNLSNGKLRRVRALTIGMVAVDAQSFRWLQDLGKLASVQGAFPAPAVDAGGVVNTPDDWLAILSSGSNSDLDSLPPSVVGALQIVQYTCPLQ